MVKEIHYTTTELKKAYQIVSDHLFTSILEAQHNQKVRLGSLGYLVKKERQIDSKLANGSVLYYHLNFKKSAPLKRALDQQVYDRN